MSEIAAAQARLDAAIVRLQSAVARRADAGRPPDALVRELASLKAEQSAMRQTTDTVATRLDAVIGRLRDIIDG
jgi:hypothetical protein